MSISAENLHAQIKALLAKGQTQAQAAKQLGVSASTVSRTLTDHRGDDGNHPAQDAVDVFVESLGAKLAPATLARVEALQSAWPRSWTGLARGARARRRWPRHRSRRSSAACLTSCERRPRSTNLGAPSLPTTIETCAPRYATARSPERKTLARAAVRLARAMGVELMPWQKMVLEVALEVDEHGRLVFRDVVLGTPRQSGKTLLELLVMLVRAMLQPRQNITYSAQSALEARKKLVDDWLPMIEASPLGSQISSYLAPGRESLRFANGSQVQIVASTAKAGHGLVVDLGIIDEAFSYRDARLEQSLRPAMMTRPSPQLWCVSTAGTPDASPYLLERVESGRQAVEANITTGLAYFEWSAEDDADPADPADLVVVYAGARPHRDRGRGEGRAALDAAFGVRQGLPESLGRVDGRSGHRHRPLGIPRRHRTRHGPRA